mmetsp:Transcript_2492/g.4481  ORF Transcript_2492/g.4481 Transcript_2492/m.4481 type:complete len:99 (-) Transcript_2492:978-1274(-)
MDHELNHPLLIMARQFLVVVETKAQNGHAWHGVETHLRRRNAWVTLMGLDLRSFWIQRVTALKQYHEHCVGLCHFSEAVQESGAGLETKMHSQQMARG